MDEYGLVNFKYDEVTPTIIKVIGVGGGGGNAVEYMYEKGICNVDFVVCNTDAKSLNGSKIATKIALGSKLTEGLGAGNNPAVGAQAAAESLESIRELLNQNTRMIFITAALGGGTGTGAAPIIAKLAKEMGILTIGVVSVPARYEGPRRIEQAREGLNRMKESVDCIIVVDNEKIKNMYGNLPLSGAFNRANDVLNIAVKGIAEIITLSGYINVDFADVCTVMRDSGVAIMGAAVEAGETRALDAINKALDSPLLNNNDVRGAKDLLFNISYGTEEITVNELREITNVILKRVGESASVIWGVGKDENLGPEISVTVIATGFLKDEVDISDDVKKSDSGFSTILAADEVVLRPDLSPENAEALRTEPAYERRKSLRV